MNILGDIKSPWLLHAKGALFVVLGLFAAGMLFAQVPTLKTAALLALTVWSFCRFYYYLFYVLERYMGREKRFAGFFDAMVFLLTKSRDDGPKS
jgi:hypothetical protein